MRLNCGLGMTDESEAGLIILYDLETLRKFQDQHRKYQGGNSIAFLWNKVWNKNWNENWNESTDKKVPFQYCRGNPDSMGTRNAPEIGMSLS